ncbi:MAG: hypothetical protein ACREQN_08205 [Candidatus Binataceae bacterium]
MRRTAKPKTEQSDKNHMLLAGIDLNFGEAALLCEALRALWLSPKFIERTWYEMLAIIRSEQLEEKWSTNADTLVTRLSRLRRSEATAMLRATIRFWERYEEPTAELLRDIGLLHPKKQTAAATAQPKRKRRKAALKKPR